MAQTQTTDEDEDDPSWFCVMFVSESKTTRLMLIDNKMKQMFLFSELSCIATGEGVPLRASIEMGGKDVGFVFLFVFCFILI